MELILKINRKYRDSFTNAKRMPLQLPQLYDGTTVLKTRQGEA
jgi:hypothetical protein